MKGVRAVARWTHRYRGRHQGAVKTPQLVSKRHFFHAGVSMTDVKIKGPDLDTANKAPLPKVEDAKTFEEKQKPLIDKWNSVWGKPKVEKKQEAPPAAKPYEPTPVEHYCEGGFGQICPNKATLHVNCDTDSLWFQLYICDDCWKTNPIAAKAEKDLPDGLRIFKIENGKETLQSGRPRKAADALGKDTKKGKEKKKAVPASGKVTSQSFSTESDKKSKFAFLFNGQGAQEVGMTKDIQNLPAVKKMFETANSILGYDLKELILKGPKEKLDSTEFSQPAMLVAGLAAYEKLRADDNKIAESVSAVAGLSLGEYTALVVAGALSLEDALKVVKIRGEAMNKASKTEKGGMVSVVGLSDDQLTEICSKAREISTDQKLICQIANYNFPKGRAISGHSQCLDKVIELAQAAGAAKASKLHVSGAFHCGLMSAASEALQKVLSSITINNPRIPVYANISGEPYKTAEDVKKGLVQQLIAPVKWEQCVDNLLRDGITNLWELAPRDQLKAMVRRQNKEAFDAMKSIRV